MTSRHRRLIGRAHRRRAQGVPLTSAAARRAYASTTPTWAALHDAVQAALVPIREAWAQILAAFRSGLMGTRADYVLMPPPYRRPTGPLIHNGRKPRR